MKRWEGAATAGSVAAGYIGMNIAVDEEERWSARPRC